jgi:hypothetical protein
LPIAFHDTIDLEELGDAAYLKIMPGSNDFEFLGAIFVINARGEPIEFAYNRVELPRTFLWRRSDLRRQEERRLAVSLLTICSRNPRLLLSRAEEVGSELFCEDLRLDVPSGRIGHPLQAVSFCDQEVQETFEQPTPLQLFWFPSAPLSGSAERRLFERLRDHRLLEEPFERAETGLAEVYTVGRPADLQDG